MGLWSIIDYNEQDNLTPIGIIGKGRERASPLTTQPTHSYKMEALGSLSLMTFARYDLKWKGGIELHMDNKGVIQTYAKCNKWSQPQWVKQKDKDVWEAIAREKREFWKNRIKIAHVESHVDNKKGPDGEKREPSPIEWMNIHVDGEAEKAYTEKIPTF